METWRKVWREGLAPQFSIAALSALRRALLTNDGRLMQGITTSPPPLPFVGDWVVGSACAVAFCGWQGERLRTVAQVEEYFARVYRQADCLLGEAGACRWFLNWFDDTPRDQMRAELVAEVDRAIALRGPLAA
jgi:hypothetical protein